MVISKRGSRTFMHILLLYSKRGVGLFQFLIGLVRAASGSGYITKEKAWQYIEQANGLCANNLRTSEEIDKSYLLGKVMKSGKIEDWDRALSCYSLLDKHRK